MKMVNLMLEHNGQEPFRFDGERSARDIIPTQPNVSGAPDPLPHLRDAETPFHNPQSPFRRLHDWVHHNQLSSWDSGGVGNKELQITSNLRSGNPNPLMGVHGLNEIAGEPSELLGKVFHRPSRGP